MSEKDPVGRSVEKGNPRTEHQQAFIARRLAAIQRGKEKAGTYDPERFGNYVVFARDLFAYRDLPPSKVTKEALAEMKSRADNAGFTPYEWGQLQETVKRWYRAWVREYSTRSSSNRFKPMVTKRSKQIFRLDNE